MSKHDQLQAQAYQWTHNTFPQFRNLIFAPRSEVIKHPGESDREFMARLGKLKAIGHRKGILDLHIDFPTIEGKQGAPYEWDAKVKPDKLKPDQHERIAALERCGGGGFAFHSLGEYQAQFHIVLARLYGKNWREYITVAQPLTIEAKVDNEMLERKRWCDQMRRSI